MRHISTISIISRRPRKALSTEDILLIVGSVFTGIGGMLLSVAPIVSSKEGAD